MFKFSKIVKASALLAGMAIASQVNAATITLGGQTATDGSGLTSDFISADNIIDTEVGFFIETFDATSTAGTTIFNDVNGAGCAIKGTASGLMVSTSSAVSTDAFALTTGSRGRISAAPRTDTTCYGYTPANGNSSIQTPWSWVEFDFSNYLTNQYEPNGITYLGLSWGSVDRYNTIEFFSGNSLVESISGGTVLNQVYANPGNFPHGKSNVYLNVDFNTQDAFDRIRIKSSGIAAEFDNLVIGLASRPTISTTTVPNPSVISLLAIGLVALFTRKKSRK